MGTQKGRIAGRGGPAPAATAAAVAAPVQQLDDQELERIGKATSRMGTADKVHFWDKQQGAQVWAGADDHVLTPEELQADADAESAYNISRALGTAEDRPTLRRHHLVTAPTVILCGHDRSHGRLVMHGSGSVLMCTAHKGGAPCTYTMPVSV